MTEIETYENIIEEWMPEISDPEKAQIIKEATEFLTNSDVPGLTMQGLIRSLCSIQTLGTVMDTSRISPHQRSVLFDTEAS